MKLKLSLVAAFVAIASLTACGGGGSSGGSGTGMIGVTPVANPSQFSYLDVTVGTGTEATTGKNATITYTGWLYSDTAANHKGDQFETGSFTFTLGSGQVIPGFDKGVLGMKVAGKRTVIIPASMAYGATGSGTKIPPNAGLVFDITLTAVQ